MKRPLFYVRTAVLTVVFPALFFSPQAKAAENALYFDTFFGNAAVNPGTPIPWTAVILRDDVPGSVFVTISNSASLAAGAKLNEADLNFNPSKNLSGLTFTFDSSSGGFALPTITKGVDAFKVGGDGKYDINFMFSVGMGTTFTAGEWVTYRVSGLADLIASDFNFLSTPSSGGVGPFYSAGHLLGLGNGQKSAWIAASGITIVAVPEPAPVLLFAVGFGLLIVKHASRRRLRRA